MISLLLSGFAHAEWSTQGSLRLSSDVLSEFALDELGTPSGIKQQGLSRVRLSATNQISDQLSWNIGLEVANGILWGDMTDVGYSVDAPFRPIRSDSSELKLIWPTACNIRYQSSSWFGAVGIQSFQWGLGLLSNHGVEHLGLETLIGTIILSFNGTPWPLIFKCSERRSDPPR